MQTWIDLFVRYMAKQARSVSKDARKTVSDQGACRVLMEKALENFERERDIDNLTEPEDAQAASSLITYTRLLFPFIKPDASPWNDSEALAIQVEPSLFGDLRDGHAPGTTDHEELIRKHATIYIDIPAGTWVLDDKREVLSIFILRDKEAEGFDLIVGNQSPAHGVVLIVKHKDFDVVDSGLVFIDYTKREIAGLPDHLSDGSEINFENYIEEINHIVKMVLLYYLTGEGQSLLPQHDPKKIKTHKAKKLREIEKQTSLFRVVKVTAPAGNFGKEKREETSGYKLGCRFKVKGHWRWQAYGVKHSLRRLQWIRAHERGSGDKVTKLHVLQER